jgi:LacI family transcriptional regulator
MKRPTRDDVARLAGVSTATVSYVVKGGPKTVAPATRRRVLDAISALGYEPNLIARSLRERRTRAFGLVIPGTAGVFFAEMADLIEVASFAGGYVLIIGNARLDEATEMTYGRILVERQVDGVIFYASEPGLAAPRYVLDHGIPVVLIDREMPGSRVRSVVVDGFAGGGLVAEHLAGLGHRVLGCIGGSLYGDPGPRGSTRRVDGFVASLRQAGIDVPQHHIRSGDYSLRSGYAITRDLFSRAPGPTGLFCCNDLMAFGALRALKELGIRVPDDVAVVGFDNIPIAEYADPPLTTVEQPRDKIAHLAVELLRDLVAQPELADSLTITLLPTLVVRNSSVRATSG